MDKIIYLLVFVSVMQPSTANAYIDPGTGAMLAQLVCGGVAGLAVILKLWWWKFRKMKNPKNDTSPVVANQATSVEEKAHEGKRPHP